MANEENGGTKNEEWTTGDSVILAIVCLVVGLIAGNGLGAYTGGRTIQHQWDRETCMERFQHAESEAATLAVLKNYPGCFEFLPTESE